MLVVSGPDHTLIQDHHAIARLGGLGIGADRADRHIQLPQAFGGERGGQLVRLVPCRLPEGAAQRQVLDRVTSQGHLGEHDHAGVLAGCAAGVVEHLGSVAGKVADAGVDLG